MRKLQFFSKILFCSVFCLNQIICDSQQETFKDSWKKDLTLPTWSFLTIECLLFKLIFFAYDIIILWLFSYLLIQVLINYFVNLSNLLRYQKNNNFSSLAFSLVTIYYLMHSNLTLTFFLNNFSVIYCTVRLMAF
jgi:hypothetical protein